MTDLSTCPGVLIAMPQLVDPHFARSVVVMLEHTEEGALGLVINHELPHECTAVTTAFGFAWPGDPHDRLRRGGPVEPRSLWMLHDDGWSFEETTRIGPGVSVSRSRESLSRLCEGRASALRLIVGYAGWGPGQLDQEIGGGSWLVGTAGPPLIFEWPITECWHRALAELGVHSAHLVEGSTTRQ